MESEPKANIAVYVDVKNLWQQARENIQARVDYRNLLRLIEDGEKITIKKAYAVFGEKFDTSKFEKGLTDLGFVIKKKLMCRYTNNPFTWDVGMSIDVLNDDVNEETDCIVFVCPSDNILDLIQTLKNLDYEVEVYGFRKHYGDLLVKTVDKFVDLTDPACKIFYAPELPKPVVNVPVQVGLLAPTHSGKIDYAGLPKDE